MFRLLMILTMFFFAGVSYADDPKTDPKPPTSNPPTNNQNQNLPPTHVTLTRKEYDELMAAQRKDKGDDKNDDPPENNDEDDLQAKARKQKEAAEKNSATTRELERAIGFNMGIDKFIVENASLLPAEITNIVKIAHSEKYDTALAKASALKASIIQSYFQVQANVDQLTPAHKATLDVYLGLTKNAKEQKAAEVYENLFEPAIDVARKLRKAEELGRSRSGLATSSAADQSYRERLIKGSRAAHLGEKST
jgi:hypothetical protein